MDPRGVLNPTPPDKLLDGKGRPYFLWDTELTLQEFRELLVAGEPVVRAYAFGKLMRQAKPDDVLTLVSPEEIASLWPGLRRYLGRSEPFWDWLLSKWRAFGRVAG